MCEAELPVTPGVQWDAVAGTGVLQPPARPCSPNQPRALRDVRCPGGVARVGLQLLIFLAAVFLGRGYWDGGVTWVAA